MDIHVNNLLLFMAYPFPQYINTPHKYTKTRELNFTDSPQFRRTNIMGYVDGEYLFIPD